MELCFFLHIISACPIVLPKKEKKCMLLIHKSTNINAVWMIWISIGLAHGRLCNLANFTWLMIINIIIHIRWICMDMYTHRIFYGSTTQSPLARISRRPYLYLCSENSAIVGYAYTFASGNSYTNICKMSAKLDLFFVGICCRLKTNYRYFDKLLNPGPIFEAFKLILALPRTLCSYHQWIYNHTS